MALTSKRYEELTAELQQILERLSAVAEELATEAVSDDSYKIVHREAKLVASRVDKLLKSLAITWKLVRLH
jgi:cob(I)alamin adenosyltransferase